MEIVKNKGFGNWIKTSITARMLMIGFIIMVLLIPLVFITELIRERSERQQEVVREVGNLWGKEVLFMGPVLKVPYKTYTESTQIVTGTKKVITERTSKIKYAYFLPDELKLDAKVDALKKERGIYTTSVFSSDIAFSGSFSKPDFEQKDVLPEDVLWEKATVIMRTSNLKGIKNQMEMQLGADKLVFLPKYEADNNNDNFAFDNVVLHELESPFLKQFDLFKKEDQSLAFSSSMIVNGSSRIRFVPVGKETSLHMTSNWADPKFYRKFSSRRR